MTPLERTLAKALTEIVIRLDISDDDAIAEGSMQLLEPMIAVRRRGHAAILGPDEFTLPNLAQTSIIVAVS